MRYDHVRRADRLKVKRSLGLEDIRTTVNLCWHLFDDRGVVSLGATRAEKKL